MGRGRAKAKQTKVARKLKYYTPDTDLTALERELRSGGSENASAADEDSGLEEPDGYAADPTLEEDEDRWAPRD
ncbi:DUF3073 domain-containing protein [Ornithinicoccus halotolerans]|uniref:DUF3073 domain-containing protein n=1 Tax=Ornithinicoccus halotolerans TaxID=1748220 RepID=UPI00129534E7|nr:DUF3073 domain-containing protein [Ornithinicoccus halotolerans]